MKDLISIIIPVYNTGEKLIKCLESIINNTYKNIEVIIIDDGSNLETAQICERCCEIFENIIVIHRENQGVSSSRNYGIEVSNGKYVMFVDSDDMLESTAIEVLYDLCEKNSADFAIIGYNEIGKKNKKKSQNSDGKTIIWKNKEVLNEFLIGSKIGWNVWGKLYSKELINNIRFPNNKKIAEDMYFTYNVCKNSSKTVLKSIPLYNYIMHDNSVMKDSNCMKFFDTADLVERVWNECKDSKDKSLVEAGKIFYVKSILWFLKFILIRDKNKQVENEILEVRTKLIETVNTYGTCKLTQRIKIEYIILNKFYYFFKIYSLIYEMKKN